MRKRWERASRRRRLFDSFKAWMLWCPLPGAGPLYELLIIVVLGIPVLIVYLMMGK